MTSSRLNPKVQVALGSAITALLIGISYHGMTMSQESDRWVRQSHEVLDGLKDFIFALERIDSAHRRFLLTGSDGDLASFRAGRLSTGLPHVFAA